MTKKFSDDIARQRYLAEIFEKERDKRLGWYFKTAKNRTEEENQSRQNEVMRRRLKAACPKPTHRMVRLRQRQEMERRQQQSDQGESLEPEPESVKCEAKAVEDDTQNRVGTLPPIDMYRVDSCIKRQIYDGCSKEGKGRYSYLKARNSVDPEVKFYFPIITSWEYGWRLGDVVKTEELKNPTHGRTRVIADTFYRSNGLPGLDSINQQ